MKQEYFSIFLVLLLPLALTGTRHAPGKFAIGIFDTCLSLSLSSLLTIYNRWMMVS